MSCFFNRICIISLNSRRRTTWPYTKTNLSTCVINSTKTMHSLNCPLSVNFINIQCLRKLLLSQHINYVILAYWFPVIYHVLSLQTKHAKDIVGTQCIPYTLPCNYANIVQVNGSKYGGILLSIVESTKTSDIQELESVQKTFIARIAGMRDIHYWDCLIHLSLMSLQRRRERFITLHMWKLLNNITSNDLNIQFVTRPRFGNLAIIPSARKNSTAANQSLFDNLFAVQGPNLWNAIPYHLNVIQDLQQFKDRLTKFMLSLSDKPPIRGYATLNSNSLLCWRNDRGTTSLWGGQTQMN